MAGELSEKFVEYLNLNKQLIDLRKQQKDIKKNLDAIENEIKTYMKDNSMDCISLKEGEIVLYPRKISKTFKRETIVEKLTEKLKCDESKAEEITNSILTNKVFSVEDKIKAVIKNK
jgi:hypothetical protein